MFCPKCGLQNGDDTKFCRNCGADLSNVLAAVEGKLSEHLAESETHNDVYSSGLRNLLLGIGFFIIAGLLFTIPGDTYYWLLMLFPAFSLIASGTSRIVKAKGMRLKETADVIQPDSFPAMRSNRELPPIQTEYTKPSKSIYATDELAGQPLSVTEPTTRQLQLDSEGETKALPKK